jgi:hypothetical protein
VPVSRTYRPDPVTAMVCVPPVPVVVLYTVDQAEASAETWMVNDRA